MVIPDLPFDEYRFCIFQRSRPIKVAYTVLLLVYGTSFSIAQYPHYNGHKDTSAFLIVVYSARHRGIMRARGVRSLLDTIVNDATGYFLLIFTVHILVILFEFFAPVSDHLADLCSSTHCKPDVGNDSGPPPAVSHHLEYRDKDELDGMLSYLQRNHHVSVAYCIKLHTFLTLPWDSLVPSMITRMILSLKKAATTPNSVGGSASAGTAVFFQRAVGGTEYIGDGDLALNSLSSEGTSSLSRSDDQI